MQGLQHRWRDEPEELAELWTLTKREHRARCVIVTHPLGWELRLTVNGELLRGQVHRDQLALLTDSDQWRTALQQKDWRLPLDRNTKT